MKYKTLGHSGLIVTDLSLGTMIFGEQSERATPPNEAARMIDRYLDMGGNHIDTANVYAGGRSEEIVGQAIKGRRANVTLATKVWGATGEGPNNRGLSRRHIIMAVEDSLRRLQTDYIDLYYMHLWDDLTPIEESLRAFDDLVTAGKVRYIGVSNFKAWQLMKALGVSQQHGWARFIAAQYQYSLIKRDVEFEFADLCMSEGVGMMPWGALGGGFLSGKYTPQSERPVEGRLATQPGGSEEAWERRNQERNWTIINAVGRVAEARGVSYTQVAVAWLRVQPWVASVIIGARTMEQLEDNLAAATLVLTPEEMVELDVASALPDLYPYRMLASAKRKL